MPSTSSKGTTVVVGETTPSSLTASLLHRGGDHSPFHDLLHFVQTIEDCCRGRSRHIGGLVEHELQAREVWCFGFFRTARSSWMMRRRICSTSATLLTSTCSQLMNSRRDSHKTACETPPRRTQLVWKFSRLPDTETPSWRHRRARRRATASRNRRCQRPP